MIKYLTLIFLEFQENLTERAAEFPLPKRSLTNDVVVRDVVKVDLRQHGGQLQPQRVAEGARQPEVHVGRGGVVVEVTPGGGDGVDAHPRGGARQGRVRGG